MANIIIPKTRETRSEMEKELRGEGWGSSMSDEKLERVKYLERKLKKEHGLVGKLHDDYIDHMKDKV